MNDKIKKFITVGYKYNDSFTEKEFEDAAFLYLKDNIMVPSYFFDEVKYSDVYRINIPILTIKGEATINYSRTVGYERTENWIEQKTTKYSDGSRKVQTYNRSRTVTDWVPDCGTISGESIRYGYDKEHEIFKDIIEKERNHKDVSEISDEVIESLNVSDHLIESLKEDICNDVFQNNMTYPGDYIKDEEYESSTSIISASIGILSIYSIEMHIRDCTVCIYTCSNGNIDLHISGTFPLEDDYDANQNIVGEIITEKRKVTKKPKRIYRLSFLLGIALFVTMLVLGIKFDILALTITSFIPLILGFIIGIKFFKIVSKTNRSYSRQIIEHNSQRENKIQELKDKGYERFINK